MQKNLNIRKAAQRKQAILQGFYDGRFKTKTEVLKKHKKIKHKKQEFL